MIDGVGADMPIITNAKGGKQAQCDYAFHLIPPKAMFALAKVFAEGAKKYSKDNWRLITPEEHYDHLQMHLNAWLAGDKQDEHLEHALARVFMLYETEVSQCAKDL